MVKSLSLSAMKPLLAVYRVPQARPSAGVLRVHLFTDEPLLPIDQVWRRMLAPWADWVRLSPARPDSTLFDTGALGEPGVRRDDAVVVITEDAAAVHRGRRGDAVRGAVPAAAERHPLRDLLPSLGGPGYGRRPASRGTASPDISAASASSRAATGSGKRTTPTHPPIPSRRRTARPAGRITPSRTGDDGCGRRPCPWSAPWAVIDARRGVLAVSCHPPDQPPRAGAEAGVRRLAFRWTWIPPVGPRHTRASSTWRHTGRFSRTSAPVDRRDTCSPARRGRTTWRRSWSASASSRLWSCEDPLPRRRLADAGTPGRGGDCGAARTASRQMGGRRAALPRLPARADGVPSRRRRNRRGYGFSRPNIS